MRERPFLTVGIGASAGGLEALQKLFRNMPRDSGMAFLVMTHQAPDKGSVLAEILQRDTEMPVAVARDGAAIESDRVYVCPPGQVIAVDNLTLRLTDISAGNRSKPIDFFLSSLAEDCKEGAAGVLLSGSGNDGTLGMRAIKEQGGITIAQGADGSAPAHSSMPDSAFTAGFADMLAPVEQIPERLLSFANAYRELNDTAQQDGERDAHHVIAGLLLAEIGHDFSGYKESTFMRRVRRRMGALQIAELGPYIEHLRQNPDELTSLFRDLLISVTSFFRDPDAFAQLEQEVIPRLFEGKHASDAIRIWVPGCATGEEVYSLAVLLRERMDALRTPPKVQIFATDIDAAALDVAREGRYPLQALAEVLPERRKRFFTGNETSCTVSKELRDLCIFSEHSVIRDPPFSRVDLISCRNLLIYLGAEFQAHAIPVFHLALRPGGYLFLGTAENIGRFSELFRTVDKKQRIFERREHAGHPLNFARFAAPARPALSAGEMRRGTGATGLRRAVETRMLERHAPAHVVVNRDGDVLHYSSHTGKYLEAAPGVPNRQLLAMARRGLRLELRGALREALDHRRAVFRRNLEVELDGRVQPIDLVIEPLNDDDEEQVFLVVFQDLAPAQAPQDALQVNTQGDYHAERLEQELRDTRERLQSTIEEYETSVEELKTSNEQLQSMNEELQSTNEEMETAKEELQSLNEELHTINAELNAKVEEVDRANADLRNLFDSAQIATIFLDRNLVIRNFTPAVAGLYNLISGDRGRPLTDIVSNLRDEGDLRPEIQAVLETGETLERRVRRKDNADHYLMRILPYRTHPKVIDGVLVTFIQVTRMVEAESQQRTMIEELNHRVRNMLTVIGAIAKQTLKRSDSPAHFTESFLGRLQAMANSYSLVAREQWGKVSLEDVLKGELTTHDGGRITLDGPLVCFSPSQAVALGLVVHELATNAAKYGAFSRSEGHLLVAWRIENDRLLLDWAESGGPEVTRPQRRGFGTDLIERQVAAALDGEISFEFDPAGVRVRMSLPAPKV